MSNKGKGKYNNSKTTYRKPHSDTKVDASNPKVRVPGEKTSNQNSRRKELYTKGFNQIRNAYDTGFFIESITFIDSMITDRLGAYVQFLLHGEDKQFVVGSLFNALTSFGSATKEKGVRDEDFKQIYNKIESWVPKRNNAVHEFVIIRQESLDESVDVRLQKLKDTADEGLLLVREVMSYTSKRTKIPND
jgi:hypothetical protein